MNFLIEERKKNRHVYELTTAELLLIESVRIIEEPDELISKISTMDSHIIKNRLLNVAAERINGQ
jgi:hypothetical protein